MKSGFFQLWLDDLADQGQHLRFPFEQICLGAGDLNELNEEPFDFPVVKILVYDSFSRIRVHNSKRDF